MAKKQINSDERQQMLAERRDAQRKRDGKQPVHHGTSYGRANMPGGERRYQARLAARDAAAKA